MQLSFPSIFGSPSGKTACLRLFYAGLIVPAALALTHATGLAQTAQTQQADPGRVEQQLKQPTYDPQVKPRVEVKELKLDTPPESADEITFELRSIQFEGLTVYDQADLRQSYKGKLGTTITLAQLYDIAADLTQKYRNDGYILSRVVVPPQTIDAGVARLRIIEGRIDSIEVESGEDEGEDEESLYLIRKYAEQLKDEGPLRAKSLERALLLINDLPGVDARSVLRPSTTVTGAADLLIRVKRNKYSGNIGINNYGTRFLGPVQTTASASANSVLGMNERLTGQVAVAWDDSEELKELEYGALNYSQPLGIYGSRISLFGSVASTEPGFVLEEIGVKGHSRSLGATLSHPFIRTRSLNLNGRASFDYRDIKSKDDLGTNVEDNIRALRFGGNLEYMDTLAGLGFNTLDLVLSKGINVFGATDESDTNVTRAEGDPQFLKLEAEIQRLQRISSEFNLLLAVRGQLSDSPLLSSEEFGHGGINYGRGYDNSEIIGDEGIAGKIELQWQEPYEFASIDKYQLFAFYDAGRIWNDDATTSGAKKETITSTGFGIRTTLLKDYNADFMLAFPINKTPQTDDDQGPRVLVNFSRRF